MKVETFTVFLFCGFMVFFLGMLSGVNYERNRVMEKSREIVEKHFNSMTKAWCEESAENRLICERLYCKKKGGQ